MRAIALVFLRLLYACCAGCRAETLLAKAEEVLGDVPAFPGSRTGGQALAGRRQDFWADVLRYGEYPYFGAGTAPHSHVGWWPLLLPASASPHAPRDPGQEREGRSAD